MKKKLSLKFVLVVTSILMAILVTVIVGLIGFYYLRKMADLAYTSFNSATDSGYELEIKSQVQTVLSTIQEEYDKFKAGEITEDEAKWNAKEIVRGMRYRDDSGGYFWIDDRDYILVMHPILPQNEGKNRYNLTDTDGVKIIQSIYASCTNGGGFNKFSFTKADGVTVAPKLAYSGIFRPWGWMISTGNYYDDIEKEIAGKQAEIKGLSASMTKILMAGILIVIAVVAVVFYVLITSLAIKPLKFVENSIKGIASGNADLSKRVPENSLEELNSN